MLLVLDMNRIVVPTSQNIVINNIAIADLLFIRLHLWNRFRTWFYEFRSNSLEWLFIIDDYFFLFLLYLHVRCRFLDNIGCSCGWGVLIFVFVQSWFAIVVVAICAQTTFVAWVGVRAALESSRLVGLVVYAAVFGSTYAPSLPSVVTPSDDSTHFLFDSFGLHPFLL